MHGIYHQAKPDFVIHLSKNEWDFLHCQSCVVRLVRRSEPLLKLSTTKVKGLSGSLLCLYAELILWHNSLWRCDWGWGAVLLSLNWLKRYPNQSWHRNIQYNLFKQLWIKHNAASLSGADCEAASLYINGECISAGLIVFKMIVRKSQRTWQQAAEQTQKHTLQKRCTFQAIHHSHKVIRVAFELCVVDLHWAYATIQCC